MVKKRLSKEYMELLRRNQNSVMTVGLAQPCLVLPPPRQDDQDQEHKDDQDHEQQEDPSQEHQDDLNHDYSDRYNR